MKEEPKPWELRMKGTIAESYWCPYCHKFWYPSDNLCKYCGMAVTPVEVKALEWTPARNSDDAHKKESRLLSMIRKLFGRS